MNPSSIAGIVVGTVATCAVIVGLVTYLFHRYRRKQKARKQTLNDDALYFKPELPGENKKQICELSGDREIMELETNERWQELDSAMYRGTTQDEGG